MAQGSELVAQWLEAGELTREKVLARMSKSQLTTYDDYWDPKEMARIRTKFSIAAKPVNGSPRIEAGVFVNILQSSGELPTSQVGLECGLQLFAFLCYLSRYPFHGDMLDDPLPQALTWREFCRGLAWLLAVKPAFVYYVQIGDEVFSRVRTMSDHRRMLFQCLAADRDADLPYDAEEASRDSWRDAQDVETNKEWARPCRDEDGDEMFHDLLQVLFCTQPDVEIWKAPASPEAFLPVAHRLHDRHDMHLHHLSIPRERFKAFVKGLLLCQFEPVSRGQADRADRFCPDELENAAESIANAFLHLPNIGITWKMFNETVRHLMTPGQKHSYLFNPILRIVPRALFGRVLHNCETYSQVPESGPDHVMNPVVMAQLHTVLSMSVLWDELKCVYHYDPSESLSSADLVKALGGSQPLAPALTIGREGDRILAISGTRRDGDSHPAYNTSDRCTFVVFLGSLTSPNHTVAPIEPDEIERAMIIQLSPVHDVFRSSTLAKTAWTDELDSVRFGTENQGTSLLIRSHMKDCVVTHTVVGGSELQTYGTNEWRGDWSLEFDIEGLEMWREVPS